MMSTPPSLPTHRIEDLPFATVTDYQGQPETLHLDLYLPQTEAQTQRPAILWFHGGGFRVGNDRRQAYIPRFASAFAARGYPGVAPDYRVRPDPSTDMPAAVRDAASDAHQALDWVRANGPQYGIDPQRLVLAGGSAGGVTILSLIHDSRQPIDARRDGIFAALDLWGTPPNPDWRPFPRVNPASPPTLIVHGTADALIPYSASQSFAEELQQAGVPHVLFTLPDAPHTPLQHFDEIVTVIAEFLREHA